MNAFFCECLTRWSLNNNFSSLAEICMQEILKKLLQAAQLVVLTQQCNKQKGVPPKKERFYSDLQLEGLYWIHPQTTYF